MFKGIFHGFDMSKLQLFFTYTLQKLLCRIWCEWLDVEGDMYSYGILLLEMMYNYSILLLEMFIGRRPTDSEFQDSHTLYNIVRMSCLNE